MTCMMHLEVSKIYLQVLFLLAFFSLLRNFKRSIYRPDFNMRFLHCIVIFNNRKTCLAEAL